MLCFCCKQGGTRMAVKDFKNAIGYIRVSTEGQAADDKFGIEAQKEKILAYANEQGYNIVEWFCDEMSGTSDDRPELNKILYGENITNPPFEAVIAFKSDRVARDTKLYFYYLYVLEKRNIKLLSTQETFPEGDFANIYRALMLFVAEQERKNIAIRTGNGRRIKAAAGGYSGGRAPLGYKIESGRLVINKDEAEIVRLIFDKKKELPLLRVAEWLNDNGYRTRSGGHFYASTIKAIVENEPTYRGLYRYGRSKDGQETPWVQGVHEPILKEN